MWPWESAGEPLAQEVLALVRALLALALGPAEELGELVVAVALRVACVLVHAQCVAQALLREPDEVVVLVLGSGYLSSFGCHRASSYRVLGRRLPGRPLLT